MWLCALILLGYPCFVLLVDVATRVRGPDGSPIMKPVVREFDARAAIPTTCGGDWMPLCEIDAAALQKSLYASHPKFYSWMFERKEIEEN